MSNQNKDYMYSFIEEHDEEARNYYFKNIAKNNEDEEGYENWLETNYIEDTYEKVLNYIKNAKSTK